MYNDETYNAFDLPIPLRDTGLLMYPVLTRDYNDFMAAVPLLTLDRRATIEGISMTDLDFLINKLLDKQEGLYWTLKFSRLLELVFHITNGVKCRTCNKVFSYEQIFSQPRAEDDYVRCPDCKGKELHEMVHYQTDEATKHKDIIVDQHHITFQDYRFMRQSLLFQNLPDYRDDSWVDPALKKDQEEKARLKSRKNGEASLERKIVCTSLATNYKIDEIFNLPMRKYLMLFGAIDDKLVYEAGLQGRMSGFVSSKEPLPHWIYKKEEDMYGSSMSLDDMKQSLSHI